MPKTVVLGITGSIAAYKAAEIISLLKKQGVAVRAILTRSGAEFITPLTLETLTGAPVVTDMFLRETPWEVEHISLAKLADVFLVAPASANFLAKAAAGIADDMLTTTFLATRAKIMIAPAMNENMYDHEATQKNIRTLMERGAEFIQPETGMLACGVTGNGRLASPQTIVDAVMKQLFPKRDYDGVRALVSAGPTVESIDPVRYITNRSSGKMGYAIAKELQERGAEVTLISGPVNLPCPDGVKRVDVTSSDSMCNAILERFSDADLLIMAAAPADFTPSVVSEHKIKKSGEELTLTLVPTRDILKAVAEMKTHQVVVGFAAETRDHEGNAKKKLAEKKLDLIACNDVSRSDAGFRADTNQLILYWPDGRMEQSDLLEKKEVAGWLLDRVAALMK